MSREEKKEKKEAAARRRSAREAEKEAGKGGKGGEERRKGGRDRERERGGDKKESGGSGARSARNFRASRVYRHFNRHRGYILQKGGLEEDGGRCTFVARRIVKVLSPGYGRRGVDSSRATRTTVARPRLETRTHCKAFLMTEEILSYTHPFRTPRLQRERFVSGDVYLRIGSRV